MISGEVRDRFPRLRLTLSGRDGPFSVEFIVDTGFDGELSLPSHLAQRLDIEITGRQRLALADGTTIFSPYYRVQIDWDEEPRLTEILVLDGNPLLGVQLLEGYWLHSQMIRNGEVELEPL